MTEKNNLDLWEQFNRPPKTALKEIAGGRLKGMTNINPQWRYQALTEAFGPCGFGWKYIVDRKWMEPGAEGEVVAFVDIFLYIKVDDQWSEPIPGHGGSKFLAIERGKLHTNDEAYKMATADAVSVAFKVLGGGADIYLGQWDGNEYVSETVDEQKLTDWLTLCKDAAKGPLKEYREWWPINKDKIQEACGTVGAAEIYSHYVALGKRMAKE